MDHVALFVLAVGVALSISAVCSLMEACLLSLSPGQVADLAKRRPAAGQRWQVFKGNIEQPISVILILNTAAHTIGATIAGAQFEKMVPGNGGLLAFSLIFTFVMLQFTEILPKTLGVRFNRQLAAGIAAPLALGIRIFKPVIAVTRWVNKPFESSQNSASAAESMAEIETLAALAHSGKLIDATQERLIRTAGKLATIAVRQIMTPRPDITFLRADMSTAEILKTLQSTRYSRLPLVDKDLDHVLGMVHLKDIFNQLHLVPGRLAVQPDPQRPEEVLALPETSVGGQLHVIGSGVVTLETLLRPMPFVPETITATSLLKRFRGGETHMAVVVDEFGTTRGVVTMEDVLEELVGEIEDEHDEVSSRPIRREGDGYRVRGDANLHDLADRLKLPDSTLPQGVGTASGLVVSTLGRMPVAGDEVSLGGFRWTVLEVDATHVLWLRVTRGDGTLA